MTEHKHYWVIKASGKKERFAEQKLRRSLRRSGAKKGLIDTIVDRIWHELEDDLHTTTSSIYARAFMLLKEDKHGVALQYSLRQAVMQLGPTGFPFEKFIGEILKRKGYDVQIGTVMRGTCVDHEVDVLARKNKKHIMIEAKFHNKPGIKSDLKVALYVQARFEDLKKKREERDTTQTDRIHEAWLITNTKLTKEAVKYAACKGLRAIGWNYPAKGNLQDLILESGVHPLTCLTTLSQGQKGQLFNQGVVLCNDLMVNKKALKSLGLGSAKTKRVLDEIDLLCSVDIKASRRGKK